MSFLRKSTFYTKMFHQNLVYHLTGGFHMSRCPSHSNLLQVSHTSWIILPSPHRESFEADCMCVHYQGFHKSRQGLAVDNPFLNLGFCAKSQDMQINTPGVERLPAGYISLNK